MSWRLHARVSAQVCVQARRLENLTTQWLDLNKGHHAPPVTKCVELEVQGSCGIFMVPWWIQPHSAFQFSHLILQISFSPLLPSLWGGYSITIPSMFQAGGKRRVKSEQRCLLSLLPFKELPQKPNLATSMLARTVSHSLSCLENIEFGGIVFCLLILLGKLHTHCGAQGRAWPWDKELSWNQEADA